MQRLGSLLPASALTSVHTPSPDHTQPPPPLPTLFSILKVSIGPVVEGEWPPGPETTAAAAVGRLIGDLETVKRHLDTVGRSGRDQFSLEVRALFLRTVE